MCVCVCVCERNRKEKKERNKERKREQRPSSTYTISDLRHSLKVKKLNSNISEALTEFFRAVMKEQRDGGGERTLLGDNTGGRAVMLLPPLWFRCFVVRVSTGLLPCIQTHS